MQIDWLTVVAQIANFLVLVWLLQRFLYRPITDAMKRREEVINTRLSEAETARKDAEAKAEALRKEQEALEAEKEDILQTARQKAEDLYQKLEQDMRAEMDTRRDTWRDHLRQEQAEFADTLRRHAGHQVIAITRDLLEQYAQTDLSGPLASGFVGQLQELDDKTRQKLQKAAADTSAPALIVTAVELPQGARSKITRALHKACDTDIDVTYETDDSVVLGVRLTIGEQTLEWSTTQYLKRLEKALDEAIDSAGATPAPQGG